MKYKPVLTKEEWQYISVLIAADLREESYYGSNVERHMNLLGKIKTAIEGES